MRTSNSKTFCQNRRFQRLSRFSRAVSCSDTSSIRWRNCLALCGLHLCSGTVEGLPISEVVQATGQSQSEVERNIERARGILLKRLANAGLAPDQKAAETVFG